MKNVRNRAISQYVGIWDKCCSFIERRSLAQRITQNQAQIDQVFTPLEQIKPDTTIV